MGFAELKAQVRRKFEREKRGAAHDFTHVERVLRNARVLLKPEKANHKTVLFTCLLHDLAREAVHEEAGDHARKSAQLAAEILPEHVPREAIPAILHAIKAHSRRSGETPQTPEARVVRDADKLDSLGTTGILRYVAQGQELGWTLEKTCQTYLEKLSSYLAAHNPLFLTKTGKKLGQKRAREAHVLVKKMLDELAGAK